MHSLVTPRPPAEHGLDSFLAASPEIAAPTMARPLRLLAAAQSPFAASKIISATHTVIRGARSRLCFGRSLAGPPEVRVLPSTQESAELWSPPRSLAAPSSVRRNEMPDLPCNLFTQPPTPEAAAADQAKGGLFGRRRQPSPKKAPTPTPTCCICLEDMPPSVRCAPLRCPTCTMQAVSRAPPASCPLGAPIGCLSLSHQCSSHCTRTHGAAARARSLALLCPIRMHAACSLLMSAPCAPDRVWP